MPFFFTMYARAESDKNASGTMRVVFGVSCVVRVSCGVRCARGQLVMWCTLITKVLPEVEKGIWRFPKAL